MDSAKTMLQAKGRQTFDAARPKSSLIIGRGPLIRFPLHLEEKHKNMLHQINKIVDVVFVIESLCKERKFSFIKAKLSGKQIH